MSEQRLQDRQFDLLLGEMTRIGDELEKIRGKLDALEGVEHAVPEIARVGRALESLAFAALGREGPRVRRGA